MKFSRRMYACMQFSLQQWDAWAAWNRVWHNSQGSSEIQRFGRRLKSFEYPSPSRPLSCLSSCKLSTLTGRTEQHTQDQIINPNVPLHLHCVEERQLHWLQATWENTCHWSAHVSCSFSIPFSPSWVNSSPTRPGHVQHIRIYTSRYWVDSRLWSPGLCGSISASIWWSCTVEDLEWTTGRTLGPSRSCKPIRFVDSFFAFWH